MTPIERLTIVVSTVGFGFAAIPLLYWSPTYEKLWLEPVACAFVAVGAAMNLSPTQADHRVEVTLGLLLLLIIVSSNLVSVARDHSRPTPYLSEAAQLARGITARDLVVTEWDDISLLYASFFAADGTTFDVPGTAGTLGVRLIAQLDERIRSTAEKGGRVYFLGVLDLSESAWTAFLGDRVHVPYQSFDRYRRCAQVVNRFDYKGGIITLRELDTSSPGCRELASLLPRTAPSGTSKIRFLSAEFFNGWI